MNLAWNTFGRIALGEYNKARWRHFAFCLIPVAIYIGATFAYTQVPLWASIGGYVVGTILLFYYRYRFMQVMVKRLHDRNMSGMLLILSPLLLILILGALGTYGATLIAGSSGGSALPKWLDGNSQYATWAVLIPFVLFNMFLRFQLSQQGTPGPNRYGPPPGVSQANMF